MVLHVRHVLECSEGNPDLREDSMKLCWGGGWGLLGVCTKSLTMSYIGYEWEDL